MKHRPLAPPEYSADEKSARNKHEAESKLSGNSTDDAAADWIDYAAAGLDNADALTQRALDVLEMVGLKEDIYALGLRGAIVPEDKPQLAARILEARAAFRKKLADPELSPLVEVFDKEKYNDNATVG